VSVGRLRTGELLAGVGAAGLFGSLFLDWFGLDTGAFGPGFSRELAGLLTKDGWSSLGWLMVVVLVAAIALTGWLVISTLSAQSVTQPVAAAVLTATGGTIAFLALLIRVLTQPDLGIGAPNSLVVVKAGAYVGLVCCLLIAAGGWIAIGDERTDAPESRTVPPEPRPAPPAS
jgi:hypothetical protein